MVTAKVHVSLLHSQDCHGELVLLWLVGIIAGTQRAVSNCIELGLGRRLREEHTSLSSAK